MRRFFAVFIGIAMFMGLFLCGCTDNQIDRGKELRKVMDTSDSKWSQAFPTGEATFGQVADYIAGWGGNANLEVTKKTDHYIILTNPATHGMKDTPKVNIALSVDPAKLRDHVPLLSLGLTSVLGPNEHGRLRLIVTEATENTWPGAESIKGKYLKCDHFIYLYKGSSDIVYTTGPLSAAGTLFCKAKRKKPSYTNAFRISLDIPDQMDPYVFEKEHSLPNPINVLGDLLASAKSSGRLFEIASFNSEDNGDFLPTHAETVVVVDDNNVESFQKRFDKTKESLEKRFKDLKLDDEEEDIDPAELFTFTMDPVELPGKVLKDSAGDNIISLMYTLQTGIHLQNEDSGAITAASYIRSVSTDKGKFSLVMDMRSRDAASMEEMSGNYLITSGLCDVNYTDTEPYRLWSSAEDSSLAAWFTASVNDEDDDPTRLQSSECDKLYAKRKGLDMIAYRYDKDHRGDALENLLSYAESLIVQE